MPKVLCYVINGEEGGERAERLLLERGADSAQRPLSRVERWELARSRMAAAFEGLSLC